MSSINSVYVCAKHKWQYQRPDVICCFVLKAVHKVFLSAHDLFVLLYVFFRIYFNPKPDLQLYQTTLSFFFPLNFSIVSQSLISYTCVHIFLSFSFLFSFPSVLPPSHPPFLPPTLLFLHMIPIISLSFSHCLIYSFTHSLTLPLILAL